MNANSVASPEQYDVVLADYLHTHSERALYEASMLSQGFIESGLGPEDIIALHFESVDRAASQYPILERARVTAEAQQFLLEIMIAYGVKYKEYLELKLRESLRDAEARASLERERTLDAERGQREKSEILAVIAHELRTPLAAAMGNIDLATRSLTRGQTERVSPLLGSAREALGRLSRLSGDLVEASRGEPPELPLVPQALDDLLAQACGWARPTAGSKGVTLRKVSGAADLRVAGNADALLSVFGNLLANAIRYTPAAGLVTVRTARDADWALVTVEDTGIGMTPEVQSRIFDKFYRAPEARAFEAQGLGLGLALVQQLVAVHGGRIEVRSSPGQGSAFTVALPLLADAEPRNNGDEELSEPE